jgi:hypothetical protein
MNEHDEKISTKEAAKLTGLSFMTLNRWRSENKKIKNGKKPHPDLKHAKLGGKVFYFKKCIAEFVVRNTKGTE